MSADRPQSIGMAESAWQTLTVAMGETVEIEVTTYITEGDLDSLEEFSSANRLHTQIDFYEQTVAHEIDRKLIDNPAYRELQRWHIEQVRQRQDSIAQNLASLAAMRIILHRDRR